MSTDTFAPPQRLADPDLFREQAYIGGEWVPADSGAVLEVDNPATEQIIGTVPKMGAAETERAIAAAEAALGQWRAETAGTRSRTLKAWHRLILENVEDLASIMTLEQGKPLAESRGEVRYAAAFIEWFAEEALRTYGETIPGGRQGQHIVVTRNPIGVTAAITPWNFPAAMITRKAGAALAAGCSMVVKPAESTPFSALGLAVLAERAGIPAGVLNIVTGDPVEIGRTMTSSPVVRKLSFTGSTAVGRKLMAQAAENIQKISLELGGNAPFIVFDDADLDQAVAGAMASKFRNTGQTCVCANRFLVQDDIHDEFVRRFSEAASELRMGDGFEEGVTQSALINREAVRKVHEHYHDAIAKGARLAFGSEPSDEAGNFVAPLIMAGITPEMRVCQEETFGPLAAVIRFSTEAEAITLANDTPYGLAAYFYTRDIHRAWRVADALEVGMVGVNEGIISNPVAPFGGVKASGLGREGSHHGIDEYLEIKYICMGGG